MFWAEDIFEEMEKMHREMDRLFSRAFSEYRPALGYSYGQGKQEKMPISKGGEPKALGFQRAPRCDLCETENSMIASFELPGAEKKDIELNVNDRSIEVKVEKKAEKEDRGKDSYSYSHVSQSFYRSIPLPKEVDSEKAAAEYKNGVLRIEVPKAKPAKTNRIEIK